MIWLTCGKLTVAVRKRGRRSESRTSQAAGTRIGHCTAKRCARGVSNKSYGSRCRLTSTLDRCRNKITQCARHDARRCARRNRAARGSVDCRLHRDVGAAHAYCGMHHGRFLDRQAARRPSAARQRSRVRVSADDKCDCASRATHPAHQPAPCLMRVACFARRASHLRNRFCTLQNARAGWLER